MCRVTLPSECNVNSRHVLNVSRLERELGRLSSPEKAGLDQRPEDRMPTELSEDIGGVNRTRDVEEAQDVRRNCFTDSMLERGLLWCTTLNGRSQKVVRLLCKQ